jgi:Kef-type K+ transport system membrane component KefB
VGVLLLVGLTGAYLDLGLVRRRGGAAASISVAGVVVPLGLGIGLGFLLPGTLLGNPAHRGTFALFLGVAMGVSAIPVIAKTLLDMRLLHRNVGQLTLCAAMVDDIVGWLLLSVVSAMVVSGVSGPDLARSIAYLVGVLLLAWLLRPAVRAALRRANATAENGTTIAMVVIMVFLGAAVTQALGLEAVFGAFVVGILISSTGVLDHAKLVALRTTVLAVLAPVFFATAGLRMDLTALADPKILLAGVGVLVTAIVGKLVGAYLGARISHVDHWEALAVGVGMNARGVIEVIIAMVGLRLGVLSPEVYTIIVLVAIATSVMAPPLLRLTMRRVEHTAEERLRAERYEIKVFSDY